MPGPFDWYTVIEIANRRRDRCRSGADRVAYRPDTTAATLTGRSWAANGTWSESGSLRSMYRVKWVAQWILRIRLPRLVGFVL